MVSISLRPNKTTFWVEEEGNVSGEVVQQESVVRVFLVFVEGVQHVQALWEGVEQLVQVCLHCCEIGVRAVPRNKGLNP